MRIRPKCPDSKLETARWRENPFEDFVHTVGHSHGESRMRILIVESDPALAKSLLRRLREQGYAVDTTTDSDHGWDLASVNEYDLVVLALTEVKADAPEMCRRLRASQPQLHILLIGPDRVTEKVKGLDSGADDYLPRPPDLDELGARVRALLRRDLQARDPLLKLGQLKLDPAARMAWGNGRQLKLTRKELGILEYLMRRPAEVVSQEELLEHVWDENANPFSHTVRVHVCSLRRKLTDNTEIHHHIETVHGQGYRLASSGDREPIP